jgi:MOSC domain-containing protein YiiM
VVAERGDVEERGIVAAVNRAADHTFGKPAKDRIRLLAGVMAVVLTSGEVRPGDVISVELPPPPHSRLERV